MGLSSKGSQSHRMVICAAVLVLMTLLILYGSNNTNDAGFSPFHVSTHQALKTTDLKKWFSRDGYVPIYGNKTMKLRCHNCALVTSSSHVLGTKAGADIDRAECVIRMNDAPTLGYDRDVGNRTTLRVVAHSSVFRVSEHDLHKHFLLSITPTKMRRFDNLFLRETGRDRQRSHSWLSTGWFTMVIAVEVCDNIKVYGMVSPGHCGKKSGSKRCPIITTNLVDLMNV
ncbi:hypothetical protein WMY93_021775 [Mugilogobius chulae]|uniref:Alpha-N-acetylgalactosaminide alpha-2,6-sialyltransferase 6 n=1 Tax=Mugilogobius chulae TaxID=88201 RepID=A0AAW0NCV1_9GOBI